MRMFMALSSMVLGVLAIGLVLSGLNSAMTSAPGDANPYAPKPLFCIALPEPDGLVLDCYLSWKIAPRPRRTASSNGGRARLPRRIPTSRPEGERT